jgi:ring-1,2-phenylacetyl-CoA epoxidase subunit PaaC
VNHANTAALAGHLLAIGDDELILGHRNSEWCGHAPILEEDIAFANLALDEIGHASLWYGKAASLLGVDPDQYPDQMVYYREPGQYRNIQMVELPRGDWAFSMLRQFFMDALERSRLEKMLQLGLAPMSEAADKILREEQYHYRHSQAWTLRLSLGTEESHARVQSALEALWPYTLQPFLPQEGENELVASRIIPSPSEIRTGWDEMVLPHLQQCQLEIPSTERLELSRSQHTFHLKVLLTDLQMLTRSEPEAKW